MGKPVTDYRALLVKYIAHVVAAEGKTFASYADLVSYRDAPVGMEFTAEDRDVLMEHIFPEVMKWASQSA